MLSLAVVNEVKTSISFKSLCHLTISDFSLQQLQQSPILASSVNHSSKEPMYATIGASQKRMLPTLKLANVGRTDI